MRHPHRLRLAAVLALGGVAAVLFATVASAGKASREAFHDEGTFVLDDYCGVPGLDVRVDFSIDLRVHVVPHGDDQLAYFLQHGKRIETLTNLANGRSVRSVARVTEKDMRVTNNGDGTLTVRVLATGNATLYGADGKAIARNPGQVRFELLIDDGGTPTDPSDDEVIESLGVVKGSTGRSDDVCEAAVPALT
jgi:hypothetical protein